MSKTRVTFVARRNWYLSTLFDLDDDIGSDYYVWKDFFEWRLKRNGIAVFEGSPFENCFMYGEVVKQSRSYAPKTFKFVSQDVLEFSAFTPDKNGHMCHIRINENEIALIVRKNSFLDWVVRYEITINSRSPKIIDMVLFAFMHDFNWNRMYFGT